MPDLERRSLGADVELRAGSRIGGVAMRYGDTASLGRGVSEVFAPGSLIPAQAVAANIRHTDDILDPSAVVTAHDDRVEVEFDAPPEVRAMVRSGELPHLSIEFQSESERFDTGSFTRTINRAALHGVALVPNPAYRETSVELRQDDAWLTGSIPVGREAKCICIGPECEIVEFERSSFDQVLADVEAGTRDVAATSGRLGASEILGSTGAGTLRLSRNDDGGLGVALTGASRDTDAAQALVNSHRAAPAIVRPILNNDASTFTERLVRGRLVRTYSNAVLVAILIKFADSFGWDVAEIAELLGLTEAQVERFL